MRNRRRHSSPVESLRLAIDCMPVATREAMLAAVRESERIITGAYVDEQGGVCPMLGAHRRGGRTDFISFARSWDRFTRAGGRKRAATPRELAILVSQLQESLLTVKGLELDLAISEHRELRRRRTGRRRRLPDSADPSGEILARRLRGRPGGVVFGRQPGPALRAPAPGAGLIAGVSGRGPDIFAPSYPVAVDGKHSEHRAGP